MKIYLTTDTHFGHEAMLRFCGRPAEFSQLILDNLIVQEGDILIHLGDFCIGNDEMWHARFVDYAGGFKRKVLVRGNHDHKSDSWYLNHGWDFVCEAFWAEYFGKKILFSHKPSPFVMHADMNIHGHFHNSNHHDSEHEITDKHKLLAIEYTNYKPVSLEKFITSPKQ